MNMQTELIYRRAVEATIRECRDDFWIVFQRHGPEKAVRLALLPERDQANPPWSRCQIAMSAPGKRTGQRGAAARVLRRHRLCRAHRDALLGGLREDARPAAAALRAAR